VPLYGNSFSKSSLITFRQDVLPPFLQFSFGPDSKVNSFFFDSYSVPPLCIPIPKRYFSGSFLIAVFFPALPKGSSPAVPKQQRSLVLESTALGF